MKALLLKDPQGQIIGWELQPETVAEQQTLAYIRNLQFYGMGEKAIAYGGIHTSRNEEGREYVSQIRWVQNPFADQAFSAIEAVELVAAPKTNSNPEETEDQDSNGIKI